MSKEDVLRKLRNAGIDEEELPKALRITTIEKALLAAVEVIEKEMFFLKENIKRDNARLKELADFLGREAL